MVYNWLQWSIYIKAFTVIFFILISAWLIFSKCLKPVSYPLSRGTIKNVKRTHVQIFSYFYKFCVTLYRWANVSSKCWAIVENSLECFSIILISERIECGTCHKPYKSNKCSQIELCETELYHVFHCFSTGYAFSASTFFHAAYHYLWSNSS